MYGCMYVCMYTYRCMNVCMYVCEGTYIGINDCGGIKKLNDNKIEEERLIREDEVKEEAKRMKHYS